MEKKVFKSFINHSGRKALNIAHLLNNRFILNVEKLLSYCFAKRMHGPGTEPRQRESDCGLARMQPELSR